MTFIEAASSGHKFKRTNQTKYLKFDSHGYLSWENGDTATLNQEWLKCDDWEVLEPKIQITKSQFMEAYKAACNTVNGGANFVSTLEVVLKMADILNL